MLVAAQICLRQTLGPLHNLLCLQKNKFIITYDKMMYRLIFASLLCCAKSFMSGMSGVLPPTTLFNRVLNVAVPIVVPAHGSIDVIHAIDEKKIKNYVAANLISYVSIPLIEAQGVDTLPLFLIASAIHFRHQFNFVKEPGNLVLSSLLVSQSINHPELVYFFITFIHTPDQYNCHKDEILRNKPLSIILIPSLTVASVLMAPALNNLSGWDGSVFVKATIVAHIIYQEWFKYLAR